MSDPYTSLIKMLSSRSISAYFQAEDQLVISRQSDPAWPDKGNSFWVTFLRDIWYLCTWVPICYKVPPTVEVVELCADFVDRGTTAQAYVPEDLVLKYGLSRLSEEKVEELFR